MKQCVITEKASQAKNVRAAIGDTYGPVLSTQGHLLRLAEPAEVNPQWAKWEARLLDPGPKGYPWVPSKDAGRKRAYDTVKKALKGMDRIWIATDCDREGQLIGESLVVEHLGFKGEVKRVMFTYEDVPHIKAAFESARDNAHYTPLAEAGKARAQADQIFNLSMSRTATVCLGGFGGIGRVRSPTLAIVVRLERTIRNFKPTLYFELEAEVATPAGMLRMHHKPDPILRSQADAQALATRARGAKGPLEVERAERSERPPQLHSLTSLQKAAGKALGLTAARTLELVQSLYDQHKLLSYPRTEVRYLPESAIEHARPVLDALDALDAFAGLATPSSPSIHTGKGGTYSDKYTAQSGEAHHALTVNPEAVQNLHGALEQLNKDERAIFMMVARSVVVAHMPVHRYRETKVKLDANGVALAASGRVTIDTGWRAGTTHTDADHDKGKKGKGSPESTPELPPVEQGMEGTVDAAKPIEKKTRAPKRLTEGDLVETMKNAWKFEDDPKERERLKEARGIGTPATRDQIIKGLRIQKLLEGRGRHIVPTTRGERLIEALEKACPELIAVALTARLEDTLDGVLRGESSAREAIERINSRASAMIDALKHHGRTLTEEEREALGAKERKDGPPSAKALEFADRIARDTNESIPKETRASAVKLSRWIDAHRRPPTQGPRPPSDKALAFARQVSDKTGKPIPQDAHADAKVLSAWLDENAGSAKSSQEKKPPSEKAIAFARKIADRTGTAIPREATQDARALSKWIDAHKNKPAKPTKR